MRELTLREYYKEIPSSHLLNGVKVWDNINNKVGFVDDADVDLGLPSKVYISSTNKELDDFCRDVDVYCPPKSGSYVNIDSLYVLYDAKGKSIGDVPLPFGAGGSTDSGILSGKAAKDFYDRVVDLDQDNEFIGTKYGGEDDKKSGYFQDGNSWIAFDNESNELWVEEFDTEAKAKGYAEGTYDPDEEDEDEYARGGRTHYSSDPRVINVKYDTVCNESGCKIAKGESAVYYPREKKFYAHDTKQAQEFREYQADLDSGYNYGKGGELSDIVPGNKLGLLNPKNGRYMFSEILKVDGNNVSLVERHPTRKQWDNYWEWTKADFKKYLNSYGLDYPNKVLAKIRKSKMASGGELDHIAIAKTKGKESIDWEAEGKAYAGNNWKHLSPGDKAEIISDLQRGYDQQHSFAKGGMTEHGLEAGDEIVHDLSKLSLSGKNKVKVRQWGTNKDFIVDLDMGERQPFAKGGNIPKVDDIRKRTYYWIADDKDGNILATGSTKKEVIERLNELQKDGRIRMAKGGKVIDHLDKADEHLREAGSTLFYNKDPREKKFRRIKERFDENLHDTITRRELKELPYAKGGELNKYGNKVGYHTPEKTEKVLNDIKRHTGLNFVDSSWHNNGTDTISTSTIELQIPNSDKPNDQLEETSEFNEWGVVKNYEDDPYNAKYFKTYKEAINYINKIKK